MRTALACLVLALTVAPVFAKTVSLECEIKGILDTMGAERPLAETVEVKVIEDFPKRIEMRSENTNVFALGESATTQRLISVGRDQGTVDVWDMSSKTSSEMGITQDSIRINRLTGTVTVSQDANFKNGLRAKISAAGKCIAQSTTRKF
ncbi:MAG: hypothetical protein Q7T87_20970 [Polaromonas sp.]|nr:hypothetical protein [Polaromonas sp.]